MPTRSLSENGIRPKGGKAIAKAIEFNASVTKISLARNEIGEEGTKVICESLKANQTLKELDLSGAKFGASNIGGPAGAKHVADMLGVNPSVTSVSLLLNKFDDETVAILLKLKEEKPNLTTLCGLKHDQSEADFSVWGLTPQDAKLLAPEILVHASLTRLVLRTTTLDLRALDIFLRA